MSERSLEDEYFQRIENEKKAKLKEKLEAEHAKEDLEARKKAHWNKCGKCGDDMETKVFRGVEIEQCPHCGAVLLDPGELQQLAGEDNSAVFSSFFSMFGSGGKG